MIIQFREEKHGTKHGFTGKTKHVMSSRKGVRVRSWVLLQGAQGQEGIASAVPKPACLEFSGLPGLVLAGRY